ncbi:hypothetical protein KRR38_01820 [Novosphingobium sp. G106]|uniref:hypothetical protein n=1 Tax=Novosphingobium sp. G106 TaxID=2849500 RepID=UPI001C2D1CBD|nr:hypothetical protein [Novosphingobium sp. G106]MBV1686440.1 hypothetical protein [Novosphingobium sp. G106]
MISSGWFSIQPGSSEEEAHDAIGRPRELGFAGGGVGIVAQSRKEWCDQTRKVGEEVLKEIV